MLMIAKNAFNILIYPSQMDFRLRLEGFSGLALRSSDRVVSLVAFALWFLDFSLEDWGLILSVRQLVLH